MPSDPERLHEYELAFRREGLPLFSEDISAWEDIFNRAAPLLGLVLIGELLGAGNLDWTWWPEALADLLRPGAWRFTLTILGLLALLAAAFLAVRLPQEARGVEREVGQDAAPLSRRQLFNVELVMFVSQAVQVLLVSLMIALFLIVFGVLAVDDNLRTQWLDSPGHELLHFQLFGERLELTSELVRVAVGLAAFSGFYFAIAMFTDSTYREEFLDELTSEMRRSFKERGEYLRLRARNMRGRATARPV